MSPTPNVQIIACRLIAGAAIARVDLTVRDVNYFHLITLYQIIKTKSISFINE
jgi:hypothetical protein